MNLFSRARTNQASLPVRLLHALLAALLFVGSLIIPTPPVAEASGDPDIGLSVDISSTTLHGADTDVTLTAHNPSGPHGYNASFIATLDGAVSYVGTSDPVTPRVETNDNGQTVLYWENVADLLTGASTSVSFTIRANPSVHGIGATPGLVAGVYANSDPRDLADFAKTGLVTEQIWEITGDYTSWDTAPADTNIVPFTITKAEGSPEHELLRGVHYQKTAYAVTVTNNPTGASTGFVIDDYLPAGLEYLGCEAADNSLAGTEEFPGAGRIDATGHPSVANCHEPSLVETVQNPSGYPSGIYTHLRWTAADLGGDSSLGAGQSFTMRYAVAVPLRANELFGQYQEPNPEWDPDKAIECVVNPGYDTELPTENPAYVAQVDDPEGPECVANPDYDSELPTENPEFVANPDYDPGYDPDTPEFIFVDAPTDGFQGSNLDNNTGPLTTDEQNLTSQFNLNGNYGGDNYDSFNTFTNTAENLAIWKEASHDDIFHGATTTWSIHIRTSEYTVVAAPIFLTDEVPDGLMPSSPSDGGVVLGSGPYVVVWDLGGMGANQTKTVTFQTTTQTNYDEGSEPPVSTGDSWTNEAEASATVVWLSGDDEWTAIGSNSDHTATGQSAGGITISKQVAMPAGGQTCGDGAGLSWGESADAGPGDRVCWRVQANFPAALSTPNFTAADFLPAGFTLTDVNEGAGHTASAADAEDYTADGRRIDWASANVGPGGQVFEAILDTTLSDPSQLDSGEDVLGNLFKVHHTNTAGQVFQYRDEAQVVQASPVLSLEKQITAINGSGAGLPAASATVRAGDVVTYSLEVTNEGNGAASVVELMDVLPAQFACSQVSNFVLTGDEDTATCETDTNTGRAVLVFSLHSDTSEGEWELVGPSESVAVTYDVEIHPEVAPNEAMVNEAGIDDYYSLANTSDPDVDPDFFEYSPANPICGHAGVTDPALDARCAGGAINVPAARDSATVRPPNVTVTKSRTTEIIDGSFNSASQATIGETVHYTVTVTIPHGTTMWEGAIRDIVNTRHTVVGGTPAATLNGAALPGDWSLDLVGSILTLDMGDSYQNPAGSGNDVVVITFDAVIDNEETNHRASANIVNNARVTHETEAGVALPQVTSSSVTTQIVEPNLAVTKTVSGDVGGVVQPGQTLTYTITVTNVNSTRVSRAHDVVVLDTVPADLSVDGGSITGGGIVVAGDVFWSLGDLAPGESVELSYEVEVADPILNSSVLTNTALGTACSIDAASPGLCAFEGGHAYDALDDVTVEAATATVSKSVDKSTATVGEVVTYTLTYTMPAGLTGFDYLIRDTYDTDLTFLEVVSAECVSGCGPDIEVEEFYHRPAEGDLHFFFGDQGAAGSEDRVFEIVYTATPNAEANDGEDLENEASLWFAQSDTVDDGDLPADPEVFWTVLTETDSETETVEVTEPDLEIDKRVNDELSGNPTWRRAVPGETLSYEVEITNSGTDDAYDIEVGDLLEAHNGAALGTVSAISHGGSFDSEDGEISWTLAGPLAPNSSITLTYEVTLPSDLGPEDEVVSGREYSNTAEITTYWGRPEAEREANPTFFYRQYSGGEDSVEIEVDLAVIGGVVWWDVDGDDDVDAAEPVIEGVSVTVTFPGMDSAFGTGDDEVWETTTDSDGRYEVTNLPGGLYNVEIDLAELPAGLSSSVDRYDTVVFANGWSQFSVAHNADLADVDFGHVGTGEVGDLVWFDQNVNGVRDFGEPGVDEVELTLTWAGWDGDFDTAGDNVTWTTDTADGLWAISELAAGEYRVEVDTTAINLGDMGAVYDLDGGDHSVAEFSLTGGQERTDVDFGFAGSSVLGDLIYFDLDSDGSRDAGEAGIPGLTVEVRWYGPDGVPLTIDDGVFEAVTDSDGEWQVDNLAPGTYQVIADATNLLENVVVTQDPDATFDGETEFGLGIGETFLGADFGYYGGLVVGDTVWLDRNGDGVMDSDEYGVGGVEVTLRWAGVDEALGTGDDVVYETTTDEGGNYTFVGLSAGEYRLTVDNLPAGTTLSYDPVNGTTDPEASVVVDISSPNLDLDFGVVGTIELSGTAWLDINANGSQDDLNGWPENGLEGRAVYVIWAGPDEDITDADDNHLYSLSTDTDGFYSLSGLAHGTYRVIASSVTTDGTYVTYNLVDGVCEADDTCEATVTLDDIGASVADIDFGVAGTGSIGDLVYYDVARNGVFDAGVDVGLAGVDVTISWTSAGYPDATHDFGTTTDANGEYLFSNLPAGDYVITVDMADLGVGMTQTADPDDTVDGSTTYELSLGEAYEEADFGFGGTNTMSGVVFYDLDADINAGYELDFDHPVPAQSVEVTWAGSDDTFDTADDYVFELITGTDGDWSLGDLPGGEYRVEVAEGIAEYADVTYNPSEDLVDGAGYDLALSVDATVSDIDFGFAGTSGFGDRVFIDRNSDGAEDSGEPGWEAEMTLLWHGPDGEAGTGDDIEFSSVSADADGLYSQDGLPAGWFSVEVVNPPYGLGVTHNVVDDQENLVSFELGDDEIRDDVDFGYGGDVSIGDLVFWDFDADGVFGEGDVGVPGADIRLTWAGADETLGTADDVACDPDDDGVAFLCATTDADGAYLVEHLPYGVYAVEFTNSPTGATITTAPEAELSIEAGEAFLEADFGFVGDARVGDRVWWDLNSNWEVDEGEPGVGGIEITFLWPGLDQMPGNDDDIALRTTTDEDGWYGFGGLVAGMSELHLTSTLPLGARILPPAEMTPLGSDDDDDDTDVFFYAFPLDLSDELLTLDFPVVGEAALEGRVYADLNGNQTEDVGEEGVAGVAVVVTWDGGTGVEASAEVVTDVNGDWALYNLPPGTYQALVAEMPAGYGLTTEPTPETVLVLGGTGSLSHGIAPFVAVSGAVFIDTDRDGSFEAGEEGVAEVTVRLLAADGTILTSAVTAADGSYLFSTVAPGSYTVRAEDDTLPVDTFWVSDPDAAIDGQHGIVVAGEPVSGVDFGLAVEAMVDNADDELSDTGPALTFLRWIALLAAGGGWLISRLGGRREDEDTTSGDGIGEARVGNEAGEEE